MEKQKTACIMCKKEGIAGTPIRDDGILQAIRGILRGFKLVVCEADLEGYKKKRERFEKMAVIHATIAAILVVAFIFGPLLLGAPFNIMGVFFSLVLGLLFAGLALLSYIPSLDDGSAESVPTPGQIVGRLMPKSLSGGGKQEAKPAKPSRKKAARGTGKRGGYARKKRAGK
jgi:hypothetical protein